jgi:xanthine dehydrogenase molybdenum-binding subunit
MKQDDTGPTSEVAVASNTTPREGQRVIGTRPPRADAFAKVTGEARFGADIHLPGMLWGKVLRSPHAHARILSIDTHLAEELPGVYAVVTAHDFPELQQDAVTLHERLTNARAIRDNHLARDKALYVGHAIAAVAARTPHLAEQALKLIEVEYEVLPPVLDVLEAMRDGAPLLHEDMRTESLAGLSETPSNISSHLRHVKGDPEKGFAEADVIVEHEFRTETVHQGYIEPHVATAHWGADGRLTVYSTTQGAFTLRDELLLLLRLPQSRIRVVPMEVGGAFGGKATGYVAATAALLARKSGRPVKIAMTRRDVFLGSGPTAGTVVRIKMGATRAGRLTAAQAELYYEAGAFPGSSWVDLAASAVFTAYDIPHGQIDGYDVVVNKPRTGSYRAPGCPQVIFATEQVVDELAEKLGMDSLECRSLNAATEGTRMIHGGVHRSLGIHEVLKAAREHPHYNAPSEGAGRGRGVAFGWWGNWGAESSSTISVNTDGTLTLVTGSVDLTGTRTTLAMQAAETLGLPLDQIKASVGDTDSIGFTQVTGGSRTSVATGTAVVKAARDVITQMCQRAALLWDVPSESVSYRRGVLGMVGDTSRTLTFGQVAALMAETGGPITGVGSVNVREYGCTSAVHIADVEVDLETGKAQVVRYTAIQNPGRAVHPSQVEGQMQGGASQGIGWALYEGYEYDEQGRMLNPHLLDYKLPTALDLPFIDTVIVEVPYPQHPHGLRGVGEMPILLPLAAVANAVYRATGVRQFQLPMTPERILESLGVI